MVPAMDRSSKTLARRPWFGLAIALAVALIDLGCARLPWKRQTQDPPMLGRVSDTTDIYAMNRRPDPSGVIATPMTATPITPSGTATPLSMPVDEVGLAMRPSEVVIDPPAAGVALQAPTAIDARTTSKSPAVSGVPNAGLVLASGERRSAASPSDKAVEVVAEARSALNSLSNYEVSLHRQERVNGALLPEEDVVVAIRREPRSVRLTWPEGPNHGREVLYRSDEPGAPMHVKMANRALPRLTLPPESPLVMKNSRHPVTEAGFDSIVEGLENAVKAPEASGIAYAGLEAAEGLDQPHHCLTQASPTGDRWRIYLDPKTHLPSLVQATDARGELLERYLFHDVRPNLAELSSNDAFDATARWGQPGGLFGRIARGDSNEPSPTPTPP
jgi:Protein of unknown function (DUF1571)